MEKTGICILCLAVLLAIMPTAMAAGPSWIQEYPVSGEMLLHLNESSGTEAYDSSGNGHHGTVFDNEVPQWVEGRYNNALYFDGAETDGGIYATEINTALDANYRTAMTVELWFKCEPSGRRFTLFDWTTPGEIDGWFVCLNRSWTKQIEWLVREQVNGPGVWVKGTANIDESSGWTHVALTYKSIDNGGGSYSYRCKMYVNGVLDAERYEANGIGGIYTNGPQPVCIGDNAGDKVLFTWAKDRQHKGWIDEVRVIWEELELSPFPSRVGVVPLPYAGIKLIGLSDSWDQTVLWKDDPGAHPGVAGCQIYDGAAQYTIADAETAGLINSTIYKFDGATQSYLSIPGTGGDFVKANEGYVIWTYQPNLDLLIPVQ
jgi:Concanavalin A-like lectin/glucanases superfamily